MLHFMFNRYDVLSSRQSEAEIVCKSHGDIADALIASESAIHDGFQSV